MEKWTPYIIFALAQAGVLIVYIVSTRSNQNALEKRVDKSDKYHALHFEHAANAEIHRRTMDKELIEARFANVGQRFEHLNDKMDGFSAELLRVRTSIHDSKDEIMKALANVLKDQKK